MQINIQMKIFFSEENQTDKIVELAKINKELKHALLQIQKKYNSSPMPAKKGASGNFFAFATQQIEKLKQYRQFNTAKNYFTASNRLIEFVASSHLSLSDITPQFICEFDEYLRQEGCSLNTISCYMRTLRAIYNKAVQLNMVPQIYPFKQCFTRDEHTRKRAIPSTIIRRLIQLDCSHFPELQLAKDIFLFSLYTRGCPFIDIAYMKQSHIQDGYLTYCRHKTRQILNVKIEPPAKAIIQRYQQQTTEGYLFPLLTSNQPEISYQEYRYQLGLYNKRLMRISLRLGTKVRLSSYVPRHTWATLAHAQGIPMSVISEGLGHTTEQTTRVYVNSLERKQLDQANRKIIRSILYPD